MNVNYHCYTFLTFKHTAYTVRKKAVPSTKTTLFFNASVAHLIRRMSTAAKDISMLFV